MTTQRNRQEIEKAEHRESINSKSVTLVDGNGETIDSNIPLSTDGDSLYTKDIKESFNDLGTFETFVAEDSSTRAAIDADVSSLFNNLDNGIQDATVGDDPKWFEFKTNRPITTGRIGIVAHTGDYSNVKIILKDRQDNVLQTIDDSNNNTKRTGFDYPVVAKNVCCIRIEFYTTDQVNVSFLRIPKYIDIRSRIVALKPDGTETEVNATTGGNLKVAIEEFDESLQENPLPTSIQASDSASIDAFGRWRVSNTGQRMDIEFVYDKQPQLMDEVIVDGATITHNADSRDVTLAINSTTATAEAEFIQHWANPYTPGNSQLIDITGTLDAAGIGGGTASIFLKNGIDSSETVITQDNWSDNTVSDVDWSKSQIFSIDFQSLKVGRLRLFLVRNGLPVKVHEITNDNVRTGGYWQLPALPLNWKLYNDGSGNTVAEIGYFNGSNGIGFRYTIPVNANAELRAICGTVKSEGGENLLDMPGLSRHVDMGTSATIVGTTLIPIMSIRMKSTFNGLANRGLAIPEGYNIQINNPIRFVLLYNATLTGASFTDVSTGISCMEYDTSATAVSGGFEVYSEYLTTGSRNTKTGAKGLLGKFPMSYGYDGVPDTITFAAIRTSSSSSSTLVSTQWREIR